MKKTTFLIGALFFCLGAIFSFPGQASAAGDWVPLERNTLYSQSSETVFDNNGVPYEVFSDLTNGNCQSLARYSDGSWENLSGPQSANCGAYYLYFNESNVPYLLQKIGGSLGVPGEIVISRYVGNAWEEVNSTRITAISLVDTNNLSSFFVDNSLSPYFINVYNSILSIFKYKNGSWGLVTQTGYDSEVRDLKSGVDSTGNIYIAYLQYNSYSDNRIVVKKYDGANWASPSSTGLPASPVKLGFGDFLIENDVLYIVYTNNTTSTTFHVQRYNGSVWENVASNTPWFISPDLSADGLGNIYFSYISYTPTNKANVLKLSGSTWTAVGTANFSEKISNLKLTINQVGTPYVSYTKDSNFKVIRYSEAAEIYYTGELQEAPENDGSIVSTLVANVVNKNFSNAGGNLIEGTHYTMANKPSGLTPIITIDASGKKASISFSGVALYHGDSNDVSFLSINFLDAAFSGGGAAAVVNSQANKPLDFNSKPYASKIDIETTSILALKSSSRVAADSNNNIYLAKMNYGNSEVTVKKYDGSSWSSVGGVVEAANNLNIHKIVVDNDGVPYVIYQRMVSSVPKVTVKKYSGGAWVTVGAAEFFSGENSYIVSSDIAFDSANLPSIIFNSDSSKSNKAVVMKFDGSAWGYLGNTNISIGRAGSPNISFDSNDVPYISFSDASDSSNKVKVRKLVNNTWTAVGSLAGLAGDVKLVIDSDDQPIIASFLNSLLQVKKFDGSSWNKLGSNNVTSIASFQPIALEMDANHTPYLVYGDPEQSGNPTLKRLINNSWELVGLPGFSVGANYYFSLFFGDGINPYVGHEDSAESYFSLTKFLLPPAISDLAIDVVETRAALSWDEDDSSGGEIDNYQVKYKTEEDDSWTAFSVPSKSMTLSRLRSNTQYESEVSAVNVLGVHSEPLRSTLETGTLSAPSSLSYSSPLVFSVGASASVTPEVIGEDLSFSVSPSLPSGLSFSTFTGAISGTPTSYSATSTYLVTAENESGSINTEVSLAINDVAPSNLSYSTYELYLFKNRSIDTVTATLSGENVVFSISPSLPSGLSFSTSTGAIVGTPTELLELTTFTVTASNSGGSDSIELSVMVSEEAEFSYDGPKYYLVNQAIEPLLPTRYPKNSELRALSLPAGLSVNALDWTIVGTPTTVSDGTYTLVAATPLGDQSVELRIVIQNIPTGLSYEEENLLAINQEVSIEPQSLPVSTVEYSISPALPTGLVLDQDTGVISGFTAELKEDGEYTVTATNMVGSASTTLKIAVLMPWVSLGQPVSGVDMVRTAVDKEGELYLAYIEQDGDLVLTRHQNNHWVTVSGFDTESAYNDFGISLDDDGNVYISYIDSNYEAGVRKYNGDSWTDLGSSVSEEVNFQKLVANNEGRLFSAISSSAGVVLKKYEEDSGYSVDNKDYSVSPSSLGYANNLVYVIDSPIDPLYPSVSGSVESYSVSPALPNGLELNTMTGVISGTPTETIADGVFTITATSESGSVSFELNLAVLGYWMSFGDEIEGNYPYKLISDEDGNYYLIYGNINNQSGILKIDSSGNSDQILYKEVYVAYYESLAIVGDYLYAAYSVFNDDSIGIEEYNLLSGTSTLILKEPGETRVYSLEAGSNGELYVAYYYSKDSGGGFIVKEYTNGSWSTLGGGPAFEGHNVNGAFIKSGATGELYFLYKDDQKYDLMLRKYDGVWQEPEVVADSDSYANGFEIDETGNLYVLYSYYDPVEDSYSLAVIKYDGNSWSTLGESLASHGGWYLAVDSNQTPYLFLSDKGAFSLFNFTGSEWSQAGPGLSYQNTLALLLDDDIPVVALSNGDWTIDIKKASGQGDLPESNSDYNTPISAFSYSSPHYYNVGSEIKPIYPTITGSARSFTASSLPAGLSIDSVSGVISGTPTATSNLGSYTVIATNDSGESISAELQISIIDSWMPVGQELSDNGVYLDSQVDDEGGVYVAYNDFSLEDDVSYAKLKYYNGSSWESIGTAISDSDENASLTKVAINEDGIYVAYYDYLGRQLLIKKFEDNSWLPIGEPIREAFKDFSLGLNQEGQLFVSLELGTGVLVKVYQNDNWEALAPIIYPATGVQLVVFEDKVDLAYIDNSDNLIVKRHENYDNSGHGREVSVINDDLVNKGIVSPQNGRPDSASIVKFNQKVNIVPFSGASVVIPPGVTMSASSSFNVANLVAAVADVSDLTSINPAGALKFGLPDLGLTLSAPITINIPVTGFSDGQVLRVYMKSAGSSWAELTSCSVLSNICSFQTTHLSEFAAGLSTASSSGSSSGSSGGLPVITTCAEVVYGDFSSTCLNGYQYRNFLSKSPLNCSLTSAQIEAARRTCGNQQQTDSSEKGNQSSGSGDEKDKDDSRKNFLAREKALLKKVNQALSNRLLGRILLQVEEKGEAWYLNPLDGARYFLGRPSDALAIMKKLALGISNNNFKHFWNNGAPARLSGRILLNVEDSGKAYYVNPSSLKLQYLGRPEDAFQVMRGAGLGINNENIRQLEIGD